MKGTPRRVVRRKVGWKQIPKGSECQEKVTGNHHPRIVREAKTPGPKCEGSHLRIPCFLCWKNQPRVSRGQACAPDGQKSASGEFMSE